MAARPLVESYTLFHHLRAVSGQGAVGGIFVFNDFVARKGMGASPEHILALLLLPALAQFVAVVWNPTDPRRAWGRRPFLGVGVSAHLLLLLPILGVVSGTPTPFIAMCALCGIAQMLLIPAQNRLLAGNYAAATRGRRFGLTTSVQALWIMALSLPAGWLLDRNFDLWPWLYAVAAAAGVYAYVHWSKIRPRRTAPAPLDLEHHASPWAALRRDRRFLAYEVCFMVYGLGFLVLQPVLPLYLNDEIRASYTEVGIAKGVLFWIAMILVGPLMGRLADRIGVFAMAAVSFAVLACFPAILLLGGGVPTVFVGYAVYGAAMAGVSIAWNLGPITLARGRDPLPYLNAHLGLVGVRALVGMTGGTLLYAAFGSTPVFVVAIALEVLAAGAMVWTARRIARAG